MSEIYIPVVPTKPTTAANRVRNSCNAVQVTVDYHGGRGIIASAYPVERKPDGIVSVLITSGESLLLESAPRLNRKKLESWRVAVTGDLVCRPSPTWDLVQKVCEKNGLTTEVDKHYPSAGSDRGDDPDYAGS